MRYEIERKAWVLDADGLRRALTAEYGEPRHVVKEDQYFCSQPGATGLGPRGRRVRIRRVGDAAIVTSKVRRLEGNTEINREYEFHVDDPESFAQFLTDYLKFYPLVLKRKHTDVYRANGMTIEFSDVDGLGAFFEVEVIADAESAAAAAGHDLNAIFAKYAAYLGSEEPRSYTSLLMKENEAPFAAC